MGLSPHFCFGAHGFESTFLFLGGRGFESTSLFGGTWVSVFWEVVGLTLQLCFLGGCGFDITVFWGVEYSLIHSHNFCCVLWGSVSVRWCAFSVLGLSNMWLNNCSWTI